MEELSADLNNSVRMLADHGNRIEDFINSETHLDAISNLELLSREIYEGVKTQLIAPEMGNLAICIDKVKQQLIDEDNNRTRKRDKIESAWAFGGTVEESYVDNNEDEWLMVERDVSDTYVHAAAKLREHYGRICEHIETIRQPVQPFFMMLKYGFTMYTSGWFSLFKMIILSFA